MRYQKFISAYQNGWYILKNYSIICSLLFSIIHTIFFFVMMVFYPDPRELLQALFTSTVFSPPKDVGICGDLVFTQYSQIPSNTLP
jgi:hypothetical protein